MSIHNKLVNAKDVGAFVRLKIFLFGKALAFKENTYGHGDISYYYRRCPRHGYFIDYPHGWKEELRCPKCEKEFREAVKKLKKRSETIQRI